MMPKIFLGKRQKPATWFFYVGWNKGRLLIIHRSTKSIRSVAQMPKDIFTHLVTPSFTRKIFKNLKKLCHVTTLTRERVHIPKLTRPGVLSTTMSAVYVFPMEKCFHIQKLSARISSKKLPHQKTSKCGY